MADVLVSAETEVYITRMPDPDDRWDNGDTAGYVSNVYAALLPDGGQTHYWGESLCKAMEGVKAGDTLYAVVADYESGDTFGRDGGHAQVLDVFREHDRAGELAKAAAPEASGDYSFEFSGKTYIRSYVGYFESLNDICVWSVTVREAPQSVLTDGAARSFGTKVGC